MTKANLKNVARFTGDPEIEAHVWKSAASWYGSIEGKLVGPMNQKAEIIATLETEARRILQAYRAKQPRGWSNG